MKSATKKWMYLFGLAAFTSLVLFLNLNRHKSKQDLDLTHVKSLTLKGQSLTAKQLNQFKHIAKRLWSSSKEIYSKPDFAFSEENTANQPTRFISVWLKEGFIYEGYFLDAWTERMNGKSSKIYLIDNNMKNFLDTFLKTSN